VKKKLRLRKITLADIESGSARKAFGGTQQDTGCWPDCVSFGGSCPVETCFEGTCVPETYLDCPPTCNGNMLGCSFLRCDSVWCSS